MQATILEKDDLRREYRERRAKCGKVVGKLSYEDIRRYCLNDLEWSDSSINDHKQVFLCVCEMKKLHWDGKTIWW